MEQTTKEFWMVVVKAFGLSELPHLQLPHQIYGAYYWIDKASTRLYGCIIADKPGIGKTHEALIVAVLRILFRVCINEVNEEREDLTLEDSQRRHLLAGDLDGSCPSGMKFGFP